MSSKQEGTESEKEICQEQQIDGHTDHYRSVVGIKIALTQYASIHIPKEIIMADAGTEYNICFEEKPHMSPGGKH